VSNGVRPGPGCASHRHVFGPASTTMTNDEMIELLQAIDVPGPPECTCPLWQDCGCELSLADKPCDCPRIPILPPCRHVKMACYRWFHSMTKLYGLEWVGDPVGFWQELLVTISTQNTPNRTPAPNRRTRCRARTRSPSWRRGTRQVASSGMTKTRGTRPHAKSSSGP
jgi:hypothetical protein